MAIHELNHAGIYLANHWPAIAGYGGGGLTIAMTLQWLKRRHKLDKIEPFKILKLIRLDGPRIVVLLFTIFTAIGEAINYLLDPVNIKYIPNQFTFLLTAAFFLHRFMVSPLGNKLGEALKPYWQAVAALKASQSKVAASPPLETAQPTVKPFSLNLN